jgi:hypothetical protein
MKAIVTGACFIVLMNTSTVVHAQANSFYFDSLLHIERANRFPFFGKVDVGQNYPNPFKPSSHTTITYMAIDAALIVYDTEGERIYESKLKPGVGRIKIDGSIFNEGLYVYALVVHGRMIERRKMLVVE